MLYLITLHNAEDREQFNLDMSSHTCNTPSIGKSSVIYDISEEFAQTLLEDERIKAVEIEASCSGSDWSRTSSNWAKSDTNNSDHDNWGIFRCVTGLSPDTWGVDGTENTTGTAAIDENGTGVRFLVWDGHPINHPEYDGSIQGGHGFEPQTIDLELDPFWSGGTPSAYKVDSFDDFQGYSAADRFTNLFQDLNPTINIFKGDTIKIRSSSTSTDHRLYFKTSPGTGTGNQVTGATGQGAYNGSIIQWTPGSTGTYYYNASGNSSLAGTIIVHRNRRIRRPNWFDYPAGTNGAAGGTYSYAPSPGDNQAHGTATAGLVAGYRQGWGTDSSIYAMDPFVTADPGYAGNTWSNLTQTQQRRNLQKFARNWMLRNTHATDETAGDFKFAAGRSVDLAEETNPVVKIMPVFNAYNSPIYPFSGSQATKVFCRKREIYALNYRRDTTVYGPSDTITTQGLTSVKCSTHTPRSLFRATANISVGDTTFTGFISAIQYENFMENAFTAGGAWTYAASHPAMSGRTITGATDTGNTITYNGTVYKLFTFSLDSGAGADQSASEANSYGFTFDYNEEVVRPPLYQNEVLSEGITELLDKGMHIVASGGNTNQYLARALDDDWDNYFTLSSTGQKYYYNRPEWFKTDNRVIVVGAVDNTTTEQKTTYSCKGPRVDLYAPGENCQAATDSSYFPNRVSYPDNPNYALHLHNGTSTAGPQVAGMLGTALSKFPHVTPLQGKEWIIGEADRDRLEIPIGDSGGVDSQRNLMGNNRYLRYGNPLSFVSKAFYPKDTNFSETFGWPASVINDNKINTFLKQHVAKNSDVYLTVRASDDINHNSILTPNNYTFSTSGGVRVFDTTGSTLNPVVSANAYYQTFRLNYANCTPGADTSVTITLTHDKYQTTGTAYKKWKYDARVGDHQNFSLSSGYGVQVWKKGEELYPRLDTSDDQIFFHSHYTGTTQYSTVDFQNIDDDFDIINGDWFIDPRIDDNLIWEQVGVGHLRLHIGTWTGSVADPSPVTYRYWVTIFRKNP